MLTYCYRTVALKVFFTFTHLLPALNGRPKITLLKIFHDVLKILKD